MKTVWKEIWVKVNRLIYLKFIWSKKIWYKQSNYWLFKCDCWNEKEIRLTEVKNWSTKSCWCLLREKQVTSNITHWMSSTRFNKIFRWIKSRCNNSNTDNYNRYWWRWIKCDWQTFEDFKNDMYKSYLKHEKSHGTKNTTIDRKENNWNYNKDNCRWATYKEQANNKTHWNRYTKI